MGAKSGTSLQTGWPLCDEYLDMILIVNPHVQDNLNEDDLLRIRRHYFDEAEIAAEEYAIEWAAKRPVVTLPRTGIASVDKMVAFFKFWVVRHINFPEARAGRA
jgi:hypothetical protein